ncbi:MAG: WxL domain-containing protein [Sporolactobacillus sp.]
MLKLSEAKKRFRSLAVAGVLTIGGLSGIGGFLGNGIAHAETPTGSADQNAAVNITGGDLTLDHSDNPIDFGSLQLDAKPHTLTASAGSFDVTDARGTGDGWHVTVAATQFTDSSTGDALPAGSLTLRQPTVSGVDGAETTGITISAPGTVDTTPGNEVPVASAAVGSGLGEYTFNQDSSMGNDGATLAIGDNTKAGSFGSTLTYKVTTGP